MCDLDLTHLDISEGNLTATPETAKINHNFVNKEFQVKFILFCSFSFLNRYLAALFKSCNYSI